MEEHLPTCEALTLEDLIGKGLFILALNFCCLTDCQILWYNCSLFN